MISAHLDTIQLFMVHDYLESRMTDQPTECPMCREITLEKIGEVKAPYLTFNEYECSECHHYQTDAPVMLKKQAE